MKKVLDKMLDDCYTSDMKEMKIDTNGGNQMETLINVVKTSTGFAHYIKQSNGVVIIEFVAGC